MYGPTLHVTKPAVPKAKSPSTSSSASPNPYPFPRCTPPAPPSHSPPRPAPTPPPASSPSFCRQGNRTQRRIKNNSTATTALHGCGFWKIPPAVRLKARRSHRSSPSLPPRPPHWQAALPRAALPRPRFNHRPARRGQLSRPRPIVRSATAVPLPIQACPPRVPRAAPLLTSCSPSYSLRTPKSPTEEEPLSCQVTCRLAGRVRPTRLFSSPAGSWSLPARSSSCARARAGGWLTMSCGPSASSPRSSSRWRATTPCRARRARRPSTDRFH